MRLLNTKSLHFKEFFDNNTPRYATLSHRWTENEVSFQEFLDSEDKHGPGFEKIKHFCSLAHSRGFEWGWIDTCCIDKKSSAELTEAINSMFRWYEQAEECYAYLSDVLWVRDELWGLMMVHIKFRESAWFGRGWTLQELLAPPIVIFFDSRWELIGTRSDLSTDISAVTGIDMDHLDHSTWSWNNPCVAVKMSWASKRETSRVEDMAYCLLGIFDVNMPLLYGEGKKAFIRLQLEIIKKSEDESIFAWTSDQRYSGLLALWPSSFVGSGDIVLRSSPLVERPPYSMTNKGLQLHVPRHRNGPKKAGWLPGEMIDLTLNCWRYRSNTQNEARRGFRFFRPLEKEDLLAITITVKCFGSSWRRVYCHKLALSKSLKDLTNFQGRDYTGTIYVHQDGL